MKITKRELKQMINESVREVLFEHGRGARLLDRTDDRFVDPLKVKSDARKEYFEEKRINRIKNTLETLREVFAEKNGLDGGYISYNYKNRFGRYDWKMEFRIKWREVYRGWEGGLNKNVLNALRHSNLTTDSYLDHGSSVETFDILGNFDDGTVEELERIVNRL